MAFAFVPLAASPAFVDQFTSVKWYALAAIAAGFLASELLAGCGGWPMALRRVALPCAALFAVPLPAALANGVDWAAPALLERLILTALALSFFWYFRARGADLRFVFAGLTVAVAITAAGGLAQAIGVQPFTSLTAGDRRSAFFGNVNMAAEFLGFALLVLLARGLPPRASRLAVLHEALLAFGALELALLASRSALLGLGAAVLLLVAVGRLDVRRLARLGVAATLAGALFIPVGSRGREGALDARHLFRDDVQQNKRDSSSLRFAAWEYTLLLVRERPLGVGLGNFPDAFIPYQLQSAQAPSETFYFRSPHNEGLRIAAEGGGLALVLAVGLGLWFARALWRCPRVARGRTEAGAVVLAGGLYYLVAAAFQFPSEVAFGALAIALLTGLALASLEPDDTVAAPRRSALPWRVGGAAVLSLIALWTWRIARSEWLFVSAPRGRAAQEEACRLNPRNLPACVTAAWLQGKAGADGAAQATLREVLLRSPYYFPAIKLLGEQALHRGDRVEGCRYLWIYDELFHRRSSVHARLGRHCEPAQFEELRATIAVPGYAAFPFATGSTR